MASRTSTQSSCFCGALSSVMISTTKENPGRRFLGCGGNYKESKCKFFCWVDPSMSLKERFGALYSQIDDASNRCADLGNEIQDYKMVLRRLKVECQVAETRRKKLEDELNSYKKKIGFFMYFFFTVIVYLAIRFYLS